MARMKCFFVFFFFFFIYVAMFYLISPSVFATVSIVVRNAIDLSTVPTGTEIDSTSYRPLGLVSKHSY